MNVDLNFRSVCKTPRKSLQNTLSEDLIYNPKLMERCSSDPFPFHIMVHGT